MANLRVLLQTHCNFTNNGSLSPSTFCPQVLGSMLKEVLTFSHLAERATYQLILFVTHKAPKICDKISSVPLTRYIKYVIKFKYCIYTNNNLSKKVLHGISYLNKFSVECQHIYIYIQKYSFLLHLLEITCLNLSTWLLRTLAFQTTTSQICCEQPPLPFIQKKKSSLKQHVSQKIYSTHRLKHRKVCDGILANTPSVNANLGCMWFNLPGRWLMTLSNPFHAK